MDILSWWIEIISRNPFFVRPSTFLAPVFYLYQVTNSDGKYSSRKFWDTIIQFLWYNTLNGVTTCSRRLNSKCTRNSCVISLEGRSWNALLLESSRICLLRLQRRRGRVPSLGSVLKCELTILWFFMIITRHRNEPELYRINQLNIMEQVQIYHSTSWKDISVFDRGVQRECDKRTEGHPFFGLPGKYGGLTEAYFERDKMKSSEI